MSTRTPPPTILLALLAVLPAICLRAQQPAQPSAESAAPSAPATAPATAPADGALADKPAASDAAAPAPGAAAATAKSDEAAVRAAAASKSKDAVGRDTLSVDFPDEDIRNILRNVADLFELNIIMPDTLQGKTTIKLRDVTWRQIFESVLSPVNYTYKEEGNIIKIVSNESVMQEPASTDVFLINYAKASDILPTITSLVDAASGGKIVVDTRSNSLIITERPSRMNRIRPIIEQLDRATDQVMIESKFVEVTNSDVKNLGVNWSSLDGYQISAGSLGGRVSRDRSQTGGDGTNANNGATRTTSDGRTTTGTISNTNAQSSGSTNSGSVSSSNGTTTNTSSTGTNGTLSNSATASDGSTTNGSLANNLTDALTRVASLTNTDGTSRSLSAVFSASDFKLVLSALQTKNQIKIVSNPTIVTLNNSEAVINVGQERPIPKYQYNQQTGTLEVNGFEFKPIGVILKVTPQVNTRGFIKLTVAPEVSQSLNSVLFNGNAIPIIDTRKTSTTVSLKDGFTMGIGGLLTSSSSTSGNKVPVLGSIPVIGRLFGNDAKRAESTNLIIFITAKTISAEGASIEQVFDSSRVRELEMRREDLPGYRDGSNPYLPELKSGEKSPVKNQVFRSASSETKK